MNDDRSELSATDVRRLMAGVRALSQRIALSAREDAECCGLTPSQAATLQALDGEKGVRLGDLGRRLGIRPSTLTRNLGRLEENGLVRRITDDRDGRVCCAALTGSGRRAAAAVARRDQSFAREVLGRIPAERRRRTLEALDDLLAAVRERTEPCCPGAFDHLMEAWGERRNR